MKTNTLLLAAALAGVSFSSSALAYTVKDHTQPALFSASELTACVVVAPTGLPLGFANTTVNVEFSLDSAGRPQDIRVPSVYDPQLKRQLVKAFSQWQFAPRTADVKTEGKRFVLLLEVKPQV